MASVEGAWDLSGVTPSGIASTYAGLPVLASDALQYVSASTKANDSNDGLSWGTAKATVAAALAALPATGGHIDIAYGTFSLGSGAVGLTLTPGKPTTIRGIGRSLTTLSYAGTGTAVKLDGTGIDPNDWGWIESLGIHCTAFAATIGVSITHAHRGYLADVYVLGNSYAAGSVGVQATQAYVNYIRDSVVAGFDSGIVLTTTCHEFAIDNTSIGAQTVCVKATDTYGLRIRGGQHSGTAAGPGAGTIGLQVIGTASDCKGLILDGTHYESNGLDVAIGRAADGSTVAVNSPVIMAPTPNGMTLDLVQAPVIVNPYFYGAGAVFTLTANCSSPHLMGAPLLLAGATMSNAATGFILAGYGATGTSVVSVDKGGTLTLSGGLNAPAANAQLYKAQAKNGFTSGNGAALAGTLWSGSGVPNIGASVAGDLYLRTDTPGTANQRLYIATAANTWTGIL